jgi:hypothetical protein
MFFTGALPRQDDARLVKLLEASHDWAYPLGAKRISDKALGRVFAYGN